VSTFVDTSVLVYAAGADHPLRGPCAAVMRAIDEGEIEAVTSAEVVQEIFHRYLAIRRPDIADALARSTLDAFAPVLPITHALMRRVPDLAQRYPGLSARDTIHVATCIHEGITEIISADRGFDAVREVRRIAPEEFTATR
jgi:predicted nucleic acid-binding protein